MMASLAKASLQEIETTPELLDFARALRAARLSAIIARRATAPGGGGAKGYPNSRSTTTGFGAARSTRSCRRSRTAPAADDDNGHQGSMPAFGHDGILKPEEISTVADYVRTLSGLPTEPGADLARGKQDLRRQLRRLPRPEGKGNREMGAPNLPTRSGSTARQEDDHGRPLERARRRDAGLGRQARSDVTIKALAVYVHTLGGGDEVCAWQPRRARDRRRSRGRRHASLADVVDEAVRTSASTPPASDEPDDRRRSMRRQEIYPQSVAGTFRRIKWVMLFVTLGIYYLLPFVRWDRGPNAPSQAVLVDFPQPALLFLLHRDLAAGSLLPHRPAHPRGDGAVPDECASPAGCGAAISARRRCGPTSSYHRALDRGRPARAHACATRRRGRSSAWRERVTKHFLWLMIAWWTGGAWVLYFADAPTLVRELATFQAPFIAYVWIGILDLHDLCARRLHARAGLPLYVPWPRIQAALDRRIRAQRHLSLRPRRTAHVAEEGRGAARTRRAGGRLHRLPAMRARLPDRRRHSRRARSRLHPVRPVHRRLRRGDEKDRPAGAPHRLRHRHQHQAPARGRNALLSDRAHAHRALCRHHCRWSAR